MKDPPFNLKRSNGSASISLHGPSLIHPTAQIPSLPILILSFLLLYSLTQSPSLDKNKHIQEMATLDSPLEVLAFDYVSFVLNNLWTWIAVVTAAVSFWRLRTTTTSSDDDGLIDESLPEPPKPQETTVALVVKTGPIVKVTETEVWTPLLCNDGVTKGKLTVYYEEEINGESDNDDGESMAVKYGGGESGEWWEKWEGVVRMRNGDDGWYRYVDLTVINGSVVRLWDANGVSDGGWVSVQRKECYG